MFKAEIARGAALAVVIGGAMTGCGVPSEMLVPAPLAFTQGFEVSDAPDAYDPQIDVFYATTREPDPSSDTGFGNEPSEVIRLGRSRVAMVQANGEPATREMVRSASTEADRDVELQFVLSDVSASTPIAHAAGPDWTITDAQGLAAAELRAAVAATPDRSLLVFVDGTKGNFYRTNALAAEARHLLGRSMPVLTFAWPSHQNIYAYIWGHDEARADAAGYPFAALMDYVCAHAGAERVHVISYSAGGRVASIGLSHLRERHASSDRPRAHLELPLGTVVFAAADEPVDRFLAEVPQMHDITDRIIVTISMRDHALVLSQMLKGEGQRISRERWTGPTDAEMQMLRDLPHVEFVDVSYGRQSRGFKIKGHSYWYRQPWVVSDVIMALRTHRPGGERGLIEEVHPHVYGMTAEYPARLRAAAEGVFPARDAASPDRRE